MSPTFAIVREYDGRVPVAHVDVYRLDRVQELHDLGLEEIFDGSRVVLVEWGDLVAPVLPGDRVVVRLRPGDDDDDDDVRVIDVAAEGSARSAALTRGSRARSVAVDDADLAERADVLLLAIDTSTRRVGVAFGSQLGVVASMELGGAASDGPPRHAEQLVPAIEHLVRTTELPLRQLSAIAVAIGPGMFTGLRVGVTTAKVMAQALRIPVIPVPSLDLVAYPLRHATRSGRDPGARCPPQRAVLRAVPRRCRAGCSGSRSTSSRRPRDLLVEIDAAGESVVVAGDGALRFRRAVRAQRAVRGRRARASRLRASPRSSSSRPSRFEREDFASAADVVPMYLRRSDAEIAHDRRPA